MKRIVSFIALVFLSVPAFGYLEYEVLTQPFFDWWYGEHEYTSENEAEENEQQVIEFIFYEFGMLGGGVIYSFKDAEDDASASGWKVIGRKVRGSQLELVGVNHKKASI